MKTLSTIFRRQGSGGVRRKDKEGEVGQGPEGSYISDFLITTLVVLGGVVGPVPEDNENGSEPLRVHT